MITKPRIAHIDGLRGVAIALVVLYHFYPQILKGGFVGVDVFFVISGYVIHRHLVTLKRYEFREFYIRRVIRIFPSLIIVVFAVAIFSQFFLLDYPKRLLLNSVIASSVFMTNFYFFTTSNYFDLESLAKPLLPLWSLAVEEQFYLLWPLLFWGFHKRFRNFLVALIAFSFISALFLSASSQNYNFYSIQTRFWEIAVGILLSTIKKRELPKIVSLFRILLICICLVVAVMGIGSDTWPNLATLLVVLASAIAIYSPGVKIEKLLSSRELIFLGRISFPLYLIHWPLLSFYSNMRPAYIPFIDKLGLLILSLVLAYLLFRFVETPIQQTRGKTRVIVTLTLSFLLFASGALALILKTDLPSSSREIRQSISSSSSVVERNDWYFSGRSTLPQPKIDYSCNQQLEIDLVFACESGSNWSAVNAVVVGDSKAEILFRALIRQDGDLNWGFVGGGLDPIIPLSKTEVSNSNNSVDSVSKIIADENQVKLIVVVAATRNLFGLSKDYSLDELSDYHDTSQILDDFKRWLHPLEAANKSIFLMRDNPTLRDPTFCHGVYSAFSALDRFVQVSENTKGCFYQIDQFRKDTNVYQNLLVDLADTTRSLTIIDSTDYFCDQSANRCDLFRENRLLYSYTDHISDFAADHVARQLLLTAQDSTL